jgi:hypothetical protein
VDSKILHAESKLFSANDTFDSSEKPTLISSPAAISLATALAP